MYLSVVQEIVPIVTVQLIQVIAIKLEKVSY